MLITYCPCCGVRNTEAHSKLTDRCVTCGKRYSQYANYKWMVKHKYSVAAERRLEELILEYRMLMQCGYKVPKEIKDHSQ